MARADVVFRLGADVQEALSALQKAETGLKQLGETAEKSGEQISSALSQDVGTAFARLDEQVSAATGGMVSLGNVFKGVAVAAVAGAAGLAATAAAVRMGIGAAIEAEDAQNSLRAALAAQGAETSNNITQLTELAGALQQLTRFSDEAVIEMQAFALNLGVNARDMGRFTQATVDMAAALNLDLNTAARMLAQTLDGTAGRLAQQVPALQGLSEEALRAGAAIDLVGNRFRGMAEEDARTLGGATTQLQNMFGELVEQFGLGFTGASDLSGAMNDLKAFIVNVTPAVAALGETLGYLAREAASVAKEFSFLFAQSENALAGTAAGAYIEAQDAVRQYALDVEKAADAVAYWQSVIPKLGDANARAQAQQELADATQALADAQAKLASGAAAVVAARAGMTPGAAGTAGANKALDAGETGATGPAAKLTAAQELAEKFAEQVNYNEQLNAIGREVFGTEQERLAAITKAVSASESLIVQMREMVVQGQLGADEAERMAEALRASEAPTSIEALMARRSSMDLTDIMLPEEQPITGEFIQNTEGLQILEREAELRQELIDLGFTQAEANELAAAAVEREANAHSVAYNAMQAAARAMQQVIQQKIAFRQATLASVSALMQEAMTGQLSAQSLLRAGLQYLAQWAGQKSLMNFASAAEEGAAAAAAAARYDPTAAAAHTASAAQHMHAGTMWGLLGAGAGAAAGAVGSGGGGGGGMGGGSDESLADFGSTRRAATTATEPGPRVAVYFTGGVVAGTSPEEFSRAIQPYLEQTVAEAGGRSSSRRG